MSSAGISFGGLASGLDTQAIISALLSLEERPIRALEAKKTSIGKQKSLFGNLNTLLDKLTDAAKALKTTSSFLQMKATSDDEDILTASANSSATPGSYAVKVMALAKAQISSASAPSATGPIGQAVNAEFMIEAGGQTYVISPVEPTLESIAAFINEQNENNEMPVRADVIDTGNPDPSQRYELVLRGTEPGLENAFTVTYSDGGPDIVNFVNALNTGGQPAQNAQLEVNGINVYRSTNQINDLFGGITLDLKSADANKEVTITVATDGEETSKKVQDLVNAYNELVDFFTAQSELDAEGKAKSPLFGDTTLRSVRSSLRGIVGGFVSTTGNPAFQMLSQIGIKADTQGKLTFTQSEFEEALNTDPAAVTKLFGDGGNGLAARLEDQIDLYTDSVDGLIKTRNDGFDRLVKQTQSRIEQAERRLENYEKQLTVKYANLETLLARLQGQGSAVGNINQNFGGN